MTFLFVCPQQDKNTTSHPIFVFFFGMLHHYRLDLAAMHKGDKRTRHIDIYIDGHVYGYWVNSGTTTDLEMVDITGVLGREVELRLVPHDQGAEEWISILEVDRSALVNLSSPILLKPKLL